jgi:hypothetical protein
MGLLLTLRAIDGDLAGWPQESVENYRKTGARASLLYPFLNVSEGVTVPYRGKRRRATLITARTHGCLVLIAGTKSIKREGYRTYTPAVEVDVEDVRPGGAE